MRPHEKLDVWKKAVELVLSVYGETRQFPIDERFGLTSQIRRAAYFRHDSRFAVYDSNPLLSSSLDRFFVAGVYVSCDSNTRIIR